MEEKKEFLNEGRYNKAEKTITFIAILVLLIGFSIGGYLIYRGVAKPNSGRIDELKVQLENKRDELQAKGITYNAFTKYTDGEAYDLKILTEVLDPSFSHCSFSEYKDNPLTKEYCKAKNSNSEGASMSFIAIGAFICFTSIVVSIPIFTFAKRRQILAFSAQQIMPVAQEGMEKIAPTVGKVGSTIAKEMAPAYGNIAKEISKGIKEGLKEEENEDKEEK